jgi:hypothetical protein
VAARAPEFALSGGLNPIVGFRVDYQRSPVLASWGRNLPIRRRRNTALFSQLSCSHRLLPARPTNRFP